MKVDVHGVLDGCLSYAYLPLPQQLHKQISAKMATVKAWFIRILTKYTYTFKNNF